MNITQTQIDAIANSLTIQLLFLQQSQHGRPTQSHTSSTEHDARALAKRFRRQDSGCQQLLQTFHRLNAEIDEYEVLSLQEKALDNIPFDILHDRADTLQKSHNDLDFQDCLAQVLVEWAKNDFLKWIDPVRCSECSGETEGVGSDSPRQEESALGGAGRVELYRCKNLACNAPIVRFPRYTKLDKLLDTRTGRCGEFAAIFMLLLRALSFRARYIWNSEDHVWNEYYSVKLGRWVHLDSCEGARDKCLLYDKGWGKKMRVGLARAIWQKVAYLGLRVYFLYCIAFSLEGAKDVTRTYVSDWNSTLHSRDSAWEGPVRSTLEAITQQRRSTMNAMDNARLLDEDRTEEAWQQNIQARLDSAESETLSGRVSGTKEWRATRSELGQNRVKPGLHGKAFLLNYHFTDNKFSDPFHFKGRYQPSNIQRVGKEQRYYQFD